MTGPVRALAMARLRRRASATVLAAGAVAAATALVAVVSGIGLVAADATLQRALAGTGAERPVVRVSRFSFSADDRIMIQAASASLEPLGAYSMPLVRGVLFRELLDRSAGTFDQLVAVDQPADASERAMVALERVGLGDRAQRAPDGLSAGERLRVAIARAIVAEPELLVLDEPTAALDRAGARAVAELLRGFDRERVTILATTHDPVLIEAASDRLDLRTARVAGSG